MKLSIEFTEKIGYVRHNIVDFISFCANLSSSILIASSNNHAAHHFGIENANLNLIENYVFQVLL